MSNPTNLIASGAYDKGTSAGKGNFEINLTLNPFNLIPYGQNYAVLSYGLSSRTDFVCFYSKHTNGTESYYLGGFHQFLNNKFLDLGASIGMRKGVRDFTLNDLFFPQLLYNIKLPKGYTIGGSIVNVISIENNDQFINKGVALDVTFFTPLPAIKKVIPKAIEAYIGVGVFKNTGMDIIKDPLYLQYSLDIIFDLKK